ncbi:MAG: NrtA/SsuA/CpmA family ABC transporter substrate-binding protein, partial [Nitrospirae bacterium]|nr:NrtA/SsuA/CpmA family ABC transporter substrate-binding protein [Nitrospirota bacterium]
MSHPGGKRRYFLLRSLAVMLMISALAFCFISCRSKKAAGPPEKITIAYSTLPNSVLVHIALLKGFFIAEGLDVTPQPHAFGKVALKAVLDGRADLATVADTPIMFAVMGGSPIYTLAVIQTSNRNEAIIANTDRGIREPADLKGRNIGVTLGTTSDFFADAFFAANGIDRELSRVIDMKPDEMHDALITGRVDAVSTWNPHLQIMLKSLGGKGLIFYGETLYTETFCLAALHESVKARPEAIKKALRALIRAEAFVKQNPEESRRLVAEFIKVDRELLDEIWDVFDFRVTLDQSLLVTLEDQTRWAIKNSLTSKTD